MMQKGGVWVVPSAARRILGGDIVGWRVRRGEVVGLSCVWCRRSSVSPHRPVIAPRDAHEGASEHRFLQAAGTIRTVCLLLASARSVRALCTISLARVETLISITLT